MWAVNLVDTLAKRLGLTDIPPVDPGVAYKFRSDDLEAIDGVVARLEKAIEELA